MTFDQQRTHRLWQSVRSWVVTVFAWHGYKDKGYWSLVIACGEDKRWAFILSETSFKQLTRDWKCWLKHKISFSSFFSLFLLLTMTCIREWECCLWRIWNTIGSICECYFTAVLLFPRNVCFESCCILESSVRSVINSFTFSIDFGHLFMFLHDFTK